MVGGSIESVSIDGRLFAVAADNEAQRKLGGFENEVQANGDGTARLIKTRVPLSISGLTVSIDDDKGDHEYLQDLADGNDFFAITITLASGKTYSGKAQIVGELQVSTQNSTASFDLVGSGKLNKQ